METGYPIPSAFHEKVARARIPVSKQRVHLYRFHQLITYYNIKYRSVGRISASNLILNDLTPEIRRAYQITIKLKALYSLVRALNSAQLIIDDRWTRIDGIKDRSIKGSNGTTHHVTEHAETTYLDRGWDLATSLKPIPQLQARDKQTTILNVSPSFN